MSTACPEWRGELATLVVGSLSPGDRDQALAHVTVCEGCRTEFGELAPLPALLSRVPADDTAHGLVDPAMLDRLLSVARQPARPLLTSRRLLAAAATVVVLAAGVTGYLVSRPAGSLWYTATNPVTHVHGRAQLRAEPTGTEVVVAVDGVPKFVRCELIAVAADGRREVAGTWQAYSQGWARVTGSTAFRPGQLAVLVVQTVDGLILIRIPV
jgi:hypothetical protein